MLTPDQIELIHSEIDGENSPKASAEVRRLVESEPEALALMTSLRSLDALFNKVPDRVPSARVTQSIRNAMPMSSRASHEAAQATKQTFTEWALQQWNGVTNLMEKSMLTKRVMIGVTTAVAVVAIIGYVVVDYKPSVYDAGTVGATNGMSGVQQAGRYKGRTITEKDVSLTNPELSALFQNDKVLKLVQSDAFHEAMNNDAFRELESSESFHELLNSEAFQQLLANDAAHDLFASDAFHDIMANDAAHALFASDAFHEVAVVAANDASHQVAANDAAHAILANENFRQILANETFHQILANDAAREVLASDSFRQIFANDNFHAILANDNFREILATDAFHQLEASDMFRQISQNEALSQAFLAEASRVH